MNESPDRLPLRDALGVAGVGPRETDRGALLGDRGGGDQGRRHGERHLDDPAPAEDRARPSCHGVDDDRRRESDDRDQRQRVVIVG